MTNEEAIEILEERWRYSKTYKYTDAEIREAFDMAIKALEQQSCEDCISRQEVLEQAKDYGSKTYLIPVNSVKTLPSVQPTRPTARWSRQTDTYHDYYECENCGIGVGLDDVRNFCPNCGAEMIESEEGNDF